MKLKLFLNFLKDMVKGFDLVGKKYKVYCLGKMNNI